MIEIVLPVFLSIISISLSGSQIGQDKEIGELINLVKTRLNITSMECKCTSFFSYTSQKDTYTSFDEKIALHFNYKYQQKIFLFL